MEFEHRQRRHIDEHIGANLPNTNSDNEIKRPQRNESECIEWDTHVVGFEALGDRVRREADANHVA